MGGGVLGALFDILPREGFSACLWSASTGSLGALTPPLFHRSDKTVTLRNLSEPDTCSPHPTAAAAPQAALPPGAEPPPIILASGRAFFFPGSQVTLPELPPLLILKPKLQQLLALVALMGVCLDQVASVIQGTAAAVCNSGSP